MQRITTIAIFSVVMVATSCAAEVRNHRWDFEDLNEWQDDSQNSSPQSYTITNGTLRIATRKQTWDRVKVRATGRFGVGKYTWRVYVPAMGEGDQASIGAFLYKDDKHEVDFEIGYGKASVRDQLTATNRDLVCYCTSQGYPSSSSQFLVEREAWHTLSIEVGHGKNGDHLIKWFMDGKQVKQLQTSFGNEIVFTVHCSVENLKFIGDHIPAQANYALFDYVDFVPPKGTQKPIRASNGLGKPIEIDGGSRAEIYVIEGWTVHVDPQMLEGEHAEAGARALTMLANHLQRIAILMPEDRLEEMRKLEIWIEHDHPEINVEPGPYHPDVDWLTARGYDPRLAKQVHVTRAASLLSRHHMVKHPAVILHELAHSYHDQVLGFDEPRIKAAYDKAMKAGIYDKVLLYTGQKVRHYAATNEKEYFAEGTEAYFYRNDFYPFVRAELKEHDPVLHALLEEIWGPIE